MLWGDIVHFYDYFQWLCRCAGVDEPTAYKGCGLNRSSVSRWRSALADGRDMSPSAKAASGIAAYFGIPADWVFTMTDKYGMSPQDWAWMGSSYKACREMHGISRGRATDGDIVSEEALATFEENGIPLLQNQLVVICGLIGEDPTVVFSAWADRIWLDSKKAPTDNGERVDDVRAAFFGGIEEGLSKEEADALWDEARDYARFKAEQMRKQKKKG